ncbi:MAG: glycosyltransferase, partial [Clostridia bacterium]|nr:glycosyltransferase [Clostridia bacterium]
MLNQILISYIFFASLSFLLYIPKLMQFCYAFKKPQHKKAKAARKIGLVVPALDESKVIGDLFDSIEKQNYAKEHFDVNVIVKDENDATVQMAKALGYNVFVVHDQTCKGEALDGYFKQLSPETFESYEAFVIVDADAVLAPDYVTELNNALEYEYDIFLTRKFIKNYLGDRKQRTIFSNCSALTYPILDTLGNNYRMEKGLPMNMCGQGMMVRRNVIEELGGWPYRTLTEDYELKLDSVLRGFKSMYYPYAFIYT